MIATTAILLLLVAAVRKPSIVPGKLQYLGESGYSLVRDGMARDVIGPKGLPFAPFLASLFFYILANNAMSIVPFFQISPMSKFAYPLVLARHRAGCSTTGSASASRASASTSRTPRSRPACPSGR